MPRRSTQITCCALVALVVLTSACSGGRKGRITQQGVSDFLAQWDLAQKSRDAESVAAHLSPKFQYELTTKGFGPTETRKGDYQHYIEATKRGFAAAEVQSLDRVRSQIAVSTDGQSAYVLFETHEAATIKGRLFRTVLSGTMKVELEDDKLAITSMEYVARPYSEGQQPFGINNPQLQKLQRLNLNRPNFN